MHITKTLADNAGDEVVRARHYISEVNLSKAGIAMLVQSYREERGNLPFRATWYHCAYLPEKDVYAQCFDFLLSLPDFAGGELTT